MKKLMALFIAFCMFIFPLAGCGNAETSETTPDSTASENMAEAAGQTDGDKTLSILYMKHWVEAADKVIEERAQQWGEENGINIVFDQIAEADFEMKIASSVENSSGPDVALFRIALPIVYQNALLDVSDVAEEIIAERGEFYIGNKAESHTGERWVTIPLYTIMSAWMYRTDILDEHGVDPPDTYDELYDICQEINNPAGGVYALGEAFSHSRDGNTFVQNVLWSYGSQLAGEDGKTVTFNSPETLAGIEYIQRLFASGVIPAGATAWDDSSNNKAWAAGQLAMTSNAPGIYYNLKNDGDPLADVTSHSKWPAGPAGRFAMLDSYSLGVLGYTPYPDEAKELLRYLTSDEVMREFYNAGGGFQFPVLECYVDMDVYQNPVLNEPVAMLEGARSPGWPGPLTQAAAEVETQSIMVDMVARVLVDGVTPQEALDEATQRIEEIYAKYE